MSESTNQMQGQNPEPDDIGKELLAKLQNEDPTKFEALWVLGDYYYESPQHDKALNCLEQLIALARDDEQRASLQLGMACIFEKMED